MVMKYGFILDYFSKCTKQYELQSHLLLPYSRHQVWYQGAPSYHPASMFIRLYLYLKILL